MAYSQELVPPKGDCIFSIVSSMKKKRLNVKGRCVSQLAATPKIVVCATNQHTHRHAGHNDTGEPTAAERSATAVPCTKEGEETVGFLCYDREENAHHR